MIKINSTYGTSSARTVMLADASGLCAYVRDLNPTAPIADTRDKGVFVGTTWSPPV